MTQRTYPIFPFDKIASWQEADCRYLAEENGLTVIRVYRDVEKYRTKNKLVEPSGSRSDRPGLLTMLRDASKGEFDVILAWREDRLYRGMRSMLMVLDAVQNTSSISYWPKKYSTQRLHHYVPG